MSEEALRITKHKFISHKSNRPKLGFLNLKLTNFHLTINEKDQIPSEDHRVDKYRSSTNAQHVSKNSLTFSTDFLTQSVSKDLLTPELNRCRVLGHRKLPKCDFCQNQLTTKEPKTSNFRIFFDTWNIFDYQNCKWRAPLFPLSFTKYVN